MTGLPIIGAGHLITKRGKLVPVRITIFGVTGVITQTVITTRVTTDQDPIVPDQTPGLITGVTIRGLTATEVIPRGDPDPAAVIVEVIPLPGEVLHHDRLDPDPVPIVHLGPADHLVKGKIKIPG